LKKKRDLYEKKFNLIEMYDIRWKIRSKKGSWQSVLLVEETEGTGENHRPVTSH
jgi:hypothetical protein